MEGSPTRARLGGRAALVALTAAIPVAILGFDPRSSQPAGEVRATATFDDGSFTQTNSRDGRSILAVSNLAPGGATHGEVTITNTGSVGGTFSLHQGAPRDSPGQGGGALSDRLRLTVRDVTVTGAPVTVYEGPLTTLDSRPVGWLAPGEGRTYAFSATFPEGAQPEHDNAYAGSATSVAYRWEGEATPPPPAPAPEPPPAEPRPEPEPTPPQPSPPQSTPPPTRERDGADRRGLRLRARIASGRLALRRGEIRVIVRCSDRCAVSVRGRILFGRGLGGTTVPARRGRLVAGDRVAVRVRVPSSTRLRARAGRPAVGVRLRLRARDRAGDLDLAHRRARLR